MQTLLKCRVCGASSRESKESQLRVPLACVSRRVCACVRVRVCVCVFVCVCVCVPVIALPTQACPMLLVTLQAQVMQEQGFKTWVGWGVDALDGCAVDNREDRSYASDKAEMDADIDRSGRLWLPTRLWKILWLPARLMLLR